MKTLKSLFLGLAIICAHFTVQSQGFINLNIESANVSGYSPGFVPATNAFPYWAAYHGTSNNPTYTSEPAYYDGASLGGALVVLVDSNAPSIVYHS